MKGSRNQAERDLGRDFSRHHQRMPARRRSRDCVQVNPELPSQMQLPSRVERLESLSERGIWEPGGRMGCHCSLAQGGLCVQAANVTVAEVVGLRS